MKAFELAKKLKLRVHQNKDGDWVCTVEAEQPWLLLSRVETQELRTMCFDAISDFHTVDRASEEGETSEHFDDVTRARAEASLQTKIRVVKRALHQQYPTLLHFVSLPLTLTEAEVSALTVETQGWASRLEEHDAIGYVAYSNFKVATLRHLVLSMSREQENGPKPEKRSPALCGRFAHDDADAYWGCWILEAIPSYGPVLPDYYHFCPACLEQWKRVCPPSPQSLQPAQIAEQSQQQDEEEVWYER